MALGVDPPEIAITLLPFSETHALVVLTKRSAPLWANWREFLNTIIAGLMVIGSKIKQSGQRSKESVKSNPDTAKTRGAAD
jgi:hypothetical protein